MQLWVKCEALLGAPNTKKVGICATPGDIAEGISKLNVKDRKVLLAALRPEYEKLTEKI